MTAEGSRAPIGWIDSSVLGVLHSMTIKFPENSSLENDIDVDDCEEDLQCFSKREK